MATATFAAHRRRIPESIRKTPEHAPRSLPRATVFIARCMSQETFSSSRRRL